MSYKFVYKRKLFRKTIKDVKGHSLDGEMDRLDVFTNTGIISIHKWSECDLYLGQDFLLFQKQEASKEAGQNIEVQYE